MRAETGTTIPADRTETIVEVECFGTVSLNWLAFDGEECSGQRHQPR